MDGQGVPRAVTAVSRLMMRTPGRPVQFGDYVAPHVMVGDLSRNGAVGPFSESDVSLGRSHIRFANRRIYRMTQDLVDPTADHHVTGKEELHHPRDAMGPVVTVTAMPNASPTTSIPAPPRSSRCAAVDRRTRVDAADEPICLITIRRVSAL